MDDRQAPVPSQVTIEEIETEATAITDRARTLARKAKGNPEALLVILREMEFAHRQICEDLFLEALPDNRHALYDLLKAIEATGGWPYIPRMKLRSLLESFREPLP